MFNVLILQTFAEYYIGHIILGNQVCCWSIYNCVGGWSPRLSDVTRGKVTECTAANCKLHTWVSEWVSGFKLSRRAPRLSMQFLPTTSQQRIALHCPQTKQQQERGFCFHRPLQLGHLLSSSGWLQSRVGVWIKARHKMGSSINWLNLCVQPKGILHSHILSSPSSLHLLTFMRN